MLKSVYALVGVDLFLQLEALGRILREAPPDVQRQDFDGESAQLAEVLDELRILAMFGSWKLVVVRSADDFISTFREPLERYIARPAAGSTLVLRVSSLPSSQRIYKGIAAVGQIVDCNPPKPRDLPAWVVRRAKTAYGLSLADDAVRVLIDCLGSDLGRLDNELAKLALQHDGPVGAAAVSASVAFQREQEMWNMTDEVAAGHTAAALKRWRHLVRIDSSAEYRAITWLSMWLEKCRRALALRRSGMSDQAIARELKIWPFEQQRKFMQTVTALGDEGVNRLIHLLTVLDLRSKSGLGDMSANVERFILAARTCVSTTLPP
jgi:DNA polymerase-3 subunit delta